MIIFSTGNYVYDSFNDNPLILNTAEALLCSEFGCSDFFLSTYVILDNLHVKLHL